VEPNHSKPRQERATWTAADEARVASSTGCDNPGLVAKALWECGDVDAAIEFVIGVMAGEEEETEGGGEERSEQAAAEPSPRLVAAEVAAAGVEGTSGQQQREQQQQPSQPADAAAVGAAPQKPEVEDSSGAISAGSSLPADAGNPPERAADAGSGSEGEQESAAAAGAALKPKAAKGGKRGVSVGSSASVVTGASKKPPRNKPCGCGSGKKYKSCCGVAAAAAERRGRALAREGAAAASESGLPTLLATLHI
jgi:hypothetical protein